MKQQITPITSADKLSTMVRPPRADLYSTGASGPPAVRPINAVNAVESTDRLGEGAIVREPDKPSAPDLKNRDWTEVKEKKQLEKETEPPKEPISKQLIEHVQSMWRASAMAVEQFQKVSETDQVERNKLQVRQEPLTYSDPKLKRTRGL